MFRALIFSLFPRLDHPDLSISSVSSLSFLSFAAFLPFSGARWMKGRGSCLRASSEHSLVADGLSERFARDGFEASVVAGGLGGWMPVSRRIPALDTRTGEAHLNLKPVTAGVQRSAAATRMRMLAIACVTACIATVWLLLAAPAWAGWGSPDAVGEGRL